MRESRWVPSQTTRTARKVRAGEVTRLGTLLVRHSPSSAAEVRRHLVTDLVAHNVPAPVVDDAILLVSELIGNAVRHGRPLPDDSIRVTWHVETRSLQVRVTDGGNTTDSPHITHAGPRDTRGRGLSIVDALSAVWGVDHTSGTNTVWAVVPLRRAADGRFAEPSLAGVASGDG